MRQFIWFDWSEMGRHHYPGHPTLSIPHNHTFYFKVELETKTDRQIEFLEFREIVKSNFGGMWEIRSHVGTMPIYDFGPNSCESLALLIADIVISILDVTWEGAEVRVSVAESEMAAGALVVGEIDWNRGTIK